MDEFKGYKTVLFNVMMLLGMMVTVMTGVDTVDDVTTMQNGVLLLLEGLTLVWGVGNLWLRAVTDSPIFNQKRGR